MSKKSEEDDDPKSLWTLAIEQAQNPWDWAFLIAGGAVGSIGTIASHFTDLGHSIPTAALCAVAFRRASVASVRRRTLHKRARKLMERLKSAHNVDFPLLRLQRDLLTSLQDWEDKLITNDEFEKELKEVVRRKAQIISQNRLPAAVPIAAEE